jgi:hypothetical protein
VRAVDPTAARIDALDNDHLGAGLVTDTVVTLVEHGHLGSRLTQEERERAEAERNRVAIDCTARGARRRRWSERTTLQYCGHATQVPPGRRVLVRGLPRQSGRGRRRR